MPTTHTSLRLACAAAGGLAALAWAAQQPIDKRLFAHDYDDVELLGKLLPAERGWSAAGLALHAANGVAFGLAYSELRRRTPRIDPVVTATGAAMVEHVGLFPLGKLVDHHHPRRDELATTWHPRAFAQATWRHLLFGALLGVLVRRFERRAA